MDKRYRMEANTFFLERYGSIINRFKNENKQNIECLKNMYIEKERIKNHVPDYAWRLFNDYIYLLDLYHEIKGKHLYAQGIKDCVSLSHFLETDFIDNDFDEMTLEFRKDLQHENKTIV